jgi:hypothetical protein
MLSNLNRVKADLESGRPAGLGVCNGGNEGHAFVDSDDEKKSLLVVSEMVTLYDLRYQTDPYRRSKH